MNLAFKLSEGEQHIQSQTPHAGGGIELLRYRYERDAAARRQTPYSFKTRFENEKGNNPEELCGSRRLFHYGPVIWAAGRRLYSD